MSAHITVIGLGEDPLDESSLLALAGAAVVLSRDDVLARVRHLLPPVVTTQPVALEPDAVRDAAAAVDGAVAVVVPAGADPGAFARALGPDTALLGWTDDHTRYRYVVAVVGLSCAGHPDTDGEVHERLGDEGRTHLSTATLVVGGARQLATVAPLLRPDAQRVVLGGDLAPALDAIADHDGTVAVVATGDPGFFGIVRALRERLGDGRIRVLPSVSSVAAAFGEVGLPWDDAIVVSAHGRDARPALNTCRRHPKVAVLTEPSFGPSEIARALAGLGRRFAVASRLGRHDAMVTIGDADEIAAGSWDDPNIVLVVDPDAPSAKRTRWPPRPTPERWALPDEAFAHRDGMVTKAEVRAVALAWLGPGVGDLVWDVGAGSGSVAVEASRLGAAAIAVEADAEQVERVRENAAVHGVPVEVVTGRAPDALVDLPDPDAVFVGGGGGDVAAITAAAAARARRVVVVALATVERVAEVAEALTAARLEVRGTQVAAARLAPLPGGHRLAALNPVFLVEGRRP